MQIQEQKSLQLLQVLRAIASLLVVLLHCTTNMAEVLHKSFLWNSFIFGGSGVDIFFVLSGFIITYTSFRSFANWDKLGTFLQRRFVRIFPTYWIIITGIIALQLLLPISYRSHFDLAPEKLMQAYLLLPGHPMINGVSWTLTYELFFYVLFATAFLIPLKNWIYYFSLAYIVCIIGLRFSGYNFTGRNNWLHLITFPQNIEFFMGVLSVALIPRLPQKFAIPFVFGGILLFIASAIFFSHQRQVTNDDFNRVIMFGIPSFLIIAGLVKYELLKVINIHNVLLLLGEASYSLYLLHLPLIAISVKILAKLQIQSALALHLIILLLVVLVSALSIYFFKWIEKPLINALNAFFKNRRSIERVKPVL